MSIRVTDRDAAGNAVVVASKEVSTSRGTAVYTNVVYNSDFGRAVEIAEVGSFRVALSPDDFSIGAEAGADRLDLACKVTRFPR